MIEVLAGLSSSSSNAEACWPGEAILKSIGRPYSIYEMLIASFGTAETIPPTTASVRLK
jgi:hypothetical protein